ncbi:hypothetical protein F9B85_10160 [Heliorestis acidaminivorans]|uniref:Uncharacterized protein n=1 Tax=Heliorestis acidaminivorans TaxID=553427 RepID=A0A6I0ERH9_9FIRM|nr:hypothetical protein [Heliorestis acidaminivorans]KAB2952166.1 hypothetical protein F9B85_10160 [Heliorestis acidaminivorans]
MILGEYFDEDNDWIIDIQYGVYSKVVVNILWYARNAYSHAERVIGVNTDLGKNMNTSSFDHRSLQYFHDMIASHFRYKHANEIEPCIPGLLDDLTDEERVLILWNEFYPDEIKRLFLRYPELPKLIVTAAVYNNPDRRGIEAEEWIYHIINDAYPETREWRNKKLGKSGLKLKLKIGSEPVNIKIEDNMRTILEDCMREKNISLEEAMNYLISVGWKEHRLVSKKDD